MMVVETDPTVTLDLLGSRGGAAAARHRSGGKSVKGIDGTANAAPRSGDVCSFRTTIAPQDIKTFVVTL